MTLCVFFVCFFKCDYFRGANAVLDYSYVYSKQGIIMNGEELMISTFNICMLFLCVFSISVPL